MDELACRARLEAGVADNHHDDLPARPGEDAAAAAAVATPPVAVGGSRRPAEVAAAAVFPRLLLLLRSRAAGGPVAVLRDCVAASGIDIRGHVQSAADELRRLLVVLRVHRHNHHPPKEAASGRREGQHLLLLLLHLLRLLLLLRRRRPGRVAVAHDVLVARRNRRHGRERQVARGASVADSPAAAAALGAGGRASWRLLQLLLLRAGRQQGEARQAHAAGLPDLRLLLLPRLLAVQLALLVALEHLQLLLRQRVLHLRRLLRVRVRQLRHVLVHCELKGKTHDTSG